MLYTQNPSGDLIISVGKASEFNQPLDHLPPNLTTLMLPNKVCKTRVSQCEVERGGEKEGPKERVEEEVNCRGGWGGRGG